MTIARRGLCLVIAAPSGAGKSSLSRALLVADPSLILSISVTTRPPRPGEEEGKHYFFRDQAEFDAMLARGELLEWAHVFGSSYGTPRRPVEEALAAGRDMVFDIDWQGHRQLRAALPDDVVGLFLLPPSLAALEQRLRGRASDEADEIARRMAQAREEMSHAGEFEHVLVNRDFAATVAAAQAILCAARLQTSRLTGLADFIAALLRGGASS
jgi:guanylate kinase